MNIFLTVEVGQEREEEKVKRWLRAAGAMDSFDES